MSKALGLAQLTNPLQISQGGTATPGQAAGGTAISYSGQRGNVIVVNDSETGLVPTNRPRLGVVQETVMLVNGGAATTSANLDISAAAVFTVNVGASPCTITFTNPPINTVNPLTPNIRYLTSFTVVVQYSSSINNAIAFQSATGSIAWAGRVTPPATAISGRQDTYSFFTFDNGVTYTGSLAINDSAAP